MNFVKSASSNVALALFHSRVLIDDGTPRQPMVFGVQLSLTVVRFKQMVEAQEGFGIGEQELFFQGSQVIALSRPAL